MNNLNLDLTIIKVKDVCQFITGSITIPTHGFENKIGVTFNHFCPDGCGCLPVVSTCGLTIDVPVHINTSQKMDNAMERAILEAPFFGCV